MTWRVAVRIAYDGRGFMGSQRQPGLPTVEGEVIRALKAVGAADSPSTSRFRAASRTDRGVSALGNVVAFDTSFRKNELLRALNAVSDTVYFLGVAHVPLSFSPRRAVRRWYRYLLPDTGLDVEIMAEAAHLFEGKHDFRYFCKEDGRCTMRIVESVRVNYRQDMVVIDVKAREFLWNMVRRMVAAMESVGKARADLQAIEMGLEGHPVQTGLVPPENLILMEVEYRFPICVECPPTLRRKLDENGQRLRVSGELQAALFPLCHAEAPECGSGSGMPDHISLI